MGFEFAIIEILIAALVGIIVFVVVRALLHDSDDDWGNR